MTTLKKHKKTKLNYVVVEIKNNMFFGAFFVLRPETVLCASAKAGIGIREIFEAIIERIPPPNRHGKLEKGFARFLLQVNTKLVSRLVDAKTTHAQFIDPSSISSFMQLLVLLC